MHQVEQLLTLSIYGIHEDISVILGENEKYNQHSNLCQEYSSTKVFAWRRLNSQGKFFYQDLYIKGELYSSFDGVRAY